MTTATRKTIVRPASRMFRAISFGVFCRWAPFDERDHAVEERLARVRRDAHHDPVRQHAGAAGHGGAVAARLADHGRRLAGDRRLVDRGDALDDLAVGGDHLAGRHDDHVVAAQVPRPGPSRRRPSGGPAGERWSRCGRWRSVSACALPRPSAIASAKLANSTVSHSQAVICSSKPRPPAAGDHDRPRARRWSAPQPTSTTNITGLRAISARVELADRIDEGRARRCRRPTGDATGHVQP